MVELNKFNQIASELYEERQKQDAKFGVQNHEPIIYMSILTEEVGEAAKEANEIHFHGLDNYHPDLVESKARYRKELVQTAAVTIAMIESFDRSEQDG